MEKKKKTTTTEFSKIRFQSENMTQWKCQNSRQSVNILYIISNTRIFHVGVGILFHSAVKLVNIRPLMLMYLLCSCLPSALKPNFRKEGSIFYFIIIKKFGFNFSNYGALNELYLSTANNAHPLTKTLPPPCLIVE